MIHFSLKNESKNLTEIKHLSVNKFISFLIMITITK